MCVRVRDGRTCWTAADARRNASVCVREIYSCWCSFSTRSASWCGPAGELPSAQMSQMRVSSLTFSKTSVRSVQKVQFKNHSGIGGITSRYLSLPFDLQWLWAAHHWFESWNYHSWLDYDSDLTFAHWPLNQVCKTWGFGVPHGQGTIRAKRQNALGPWLRHGKRGLCNAPWATTAFCAERPGWLVDHFSTCSCSTFPYWSHCTVYSFVKSLLLEFELL